MPYLAQSCSITFVPISRPHATTISVSGVPMRQFDHASGFRRESQMQVPVESWFTSRGLLTKTEFSLPWGICDFVGRDDRSRVVPANKKKDPRYAGIYRDMPGYSGI